MKFNQHSIHVNLAKKAIILAIMLGLIISFVQILFDLQEERHLYQSFVNNILKSNQHSTAESVYSADYKYAQIIAEGLVQFDEVANITIFEEHGKTVAYAGNTVDLKQSDWISVYIVKDALETSLPLLTRYNQDEIGRIKLVVDPDILGARFIKRAERIFISGLFKNFILMFALTILFYFILSKPLLKTIQEINLIKKSDQPNSKISNHLSDRKDELGQLIRTFFSLIDKQKQAEKNLHHAAFYDSLTNLPNRALLIDRLHQAINSCQRNKIFGAILFLDLDNFKNINDTLGHHIGDQLLILVSERLTHIFRAEDTISRFGGDEFIILLPNIGGLDTPLHEVIDQNAQKILNIFIEPFFIKNHEIKTQTSIGITVFPNSTSNETDILKQGDAAMYLAKSKGGNNFQRYTPELNSLINKRINMENDLRKALLNDEFFLMYQPQCDYEGKIIGKEALVRWQHPTKGVISPVDFIPIAESSGIIIELGEWVLNKACNDLKNFCSINPCRLSINVSSLQIHQEDYVESVRTCLENSQYNPEQLTLEMTEHTMIDDIENTRNKLHELNQMGIELSIDDFGTGYSSMRYLQQLPISEIKIDKSFIDHVTTNKNDAGIVETILTMARHLNMSVVSEGVETKEQLEFLKQLDCKVFQGYYFHKPLQLEEIKKLNV